MFPGQANTRLRPELRYFCAFVCVACGFEGVVPPPLIRYAPFPMSTRVVFIKGREDVLQVARVVRVCPICVVATRSFPCRFRRVFFDSQVSEVGRVFILMECTGVFRPLNSKPITRQNGIFPISRQGDCRPNITFRAPLITFFGNGDRQVVAKVSTKFPYRSEVGEFSEQEVWRVPTYTYLGRSDVRVNDLRFVRSVRRFFLLLTSALEASDAYTKPIRAVRHYRPYNTSFVFKLHYRKRREGRG